MSGRIALHLDQGLGWTKPLTVACCAPPAAPSWPATPTRTGPSERPGADAAQAVAPAPPGGCPARPARPPTSQSRSGPRQPTRRSATTLFLCPPQPPLSPHPTGRSPPPPPSPRRFPDPVPFVPLEGVLSWLEAASGRSTWATAPGPSAAWPAAWPCTAVTSAPPTGSSPATAANPSSPWAAGAVGPPSHSPRARWGGATPDPHPGRTRRPPPTNNPPEGAASCTEPPAPATPAPCPAGGQPPAGASRSPPGAPWSTRALCPCCTPARWPAGGGPSWPWPASAPWPASSSAMTTPLPACPPAGWSPSRWPPWWWCC